MMEWKGVGRLNAIPLELICHILSFLEYHDLLRCSETCMFLSKIISTSPPLLYTIDLAIAGLVSTPGFKRFPLAARRRYLAKREQSWKYLRWNNYGPLDIGQTGSVYEFIGGIYAHGREDDRKLAGSISFYQFNEGYLSTPDGGLEKAKKWAHSMEDLSVIDFTMEPIQDLLVLIGRAPETSGFLYEAQIRSLSTNEPHPLVPSNSRFLALVKDHTHDQNGLFTSVRVQIVGLYVGLIIKEVLNGGGGAHLEIWNWRAGPARSCILSSKIGIDDFCFLSADSFLIAHPEGLFEVYSFCDPALSDKFVNAMYWYISMSLNPVPGYIPSVQSPSPGSPLQQSQADVSSMTQSRTTFEPPPFYPRSDERILSCSIYVFDPRRPADHENSFVFFVNTRTFLRSRSDISKACEHVPLYQWDAWGPWATRFFEEQLGTDWQHALFGYRTVEKIETTAPSRLKVRDFNPVSVARASEEEQEYHYESEDGKSIGKRRVRVVKGSSTISKGTAFKEDIVTSLPYVEVESAESFEATDVMMDDSRILLLKRELTGGPCGINVLSVP